MIKLVKGVINFQQNILPKLKDQFAQLAEGQKPDALMIACSDSRVVPNLFASTDPGDLFVVRNPGNLVPPASKQTRKNGYSEAAAVEVAVESLAVKDIIVCGHSRCAGMSALLSANKGTSYLTRWIRHGRAAKKWLEQGTTLDSALTPQDQLSQLNVLLQLEHLRSYPSVLEKMLAGSLRLHGWWFDIGVGNVYAFEPDVERFVVIDPTEGAKILQRITSGS